MKIATHLLSIGKLKIGWGKPSPLHHLTTTTNIATATLEFNLSPLMHYLICPIHHTPMTNPYILTDGISYDKHSLEKIKKSPITNLPIDKNNSNFTDASLHLSRIKCKRFT